MPEKGSPNPPLWGQTPVPPDPCFPCASHNQDISLSPRPNLFMAKEGKDDLEAVRKLVDALSDFDNTEQERIIRWACEKLGLPSAVGISRTLPPKPGVVADFSSTGAIDSRRPARDIKAFIEEKSPKNDRQLAAVVAYYYAFEAPESNRKASIGSTDLVEACRLAQKHRPKTPGQTLINAAHSGLLDKADETGKYKLNAVGENLVAMALPGGAEGRRSSKRTLSPS